MAGRRLENTYHIPKIPPPMSTKLVKGLKGSRSARFGGSSTEVSCGPRTWQGSLIDMAEPSGSLLDPDPSPMRGCHSTLRIDACLEQNRLSSLFSASAPHLAIGPRGSRGLEQQRDEMERQMLLDGSMDNINLTDRRSSGLGVSNSAFSPPKGSANSSPSAFILPQPNQSISASTPALAITPPPTAPGRCSPHGASGASGSSPVLIHIPSSQSSFTDFSRPHNFDKPTINIQAVSTTNLHSVDPFSPPYSEFDIVGQSSTARFPWQRDIGVQCSLISGVPIVWPPPDDSPVRPDPPRLDPPRIDTPPRIRSPIPIRPKALHPALTRCHSAEPSQFPKKPGGDSPILDKAESRPLSGSDMELCKHAAESVVNRPRRPALLLIDVDNNVTKSTNDIEIICDTDDDEPYAGGRRPSRYRADSLVSPPPGYPRNSCIFKYGAQSVDLLGGDAPSTDLGIRTDTLSSPRVSPVPWMCSGGQAMLGAPGGLVPELVITGTDSAGKPKSDGFVKKSGNLLTVPSMQVMRRTSSGSLASVSDESDTEPSPPMSRRMGRRQAIFDSKSLGLGPAAEDISPTTSCDEADGLSVQSFPERGRKRSSVDLGTNYPGDLLVHKSNKKVLIKRKTIADFAETRSYQTSQTSLISSETESKKKMKGTLSWFKIDKKSKDSISELGDVLSKLKPSSFKDNFLTYYKDVHWTDLIPSTDKDRESHSVTETERKRREAVWELFRSECVFLIDHLMVLKHCFMEPMKKVQVEGHLMFSEPGDLFGNLDELCYVSYTFCREFISLLLKDASASNFGRAEILVKAFQRFTQLSRDGEVYHNYCLNYSKAVNYLDNMRKNDDFCEFEKWCEQDIRCHRLQLTDLLISPMQHCTKVPLLLNNIRKYTEDQDERHQLLESIEKLETSLKNLEAKMKWLKNFERVQEIQQQIIWQPITEMDPRAFIPDFLRGTLNKQPCERLLASPKRQLLYEGPLTLIEINKTVDMYLFLFDDILLLTKVKKSPRKKTSTGENLQGHPRPQTEGAVFVVYRQPIALDRFTIHDVRPPDGAGFWEYFECGVHVSFGDHKECLPNWDDEYNTRSNLFFGCLSAANGLKNAFVLVQISRFQQIIGVYTLQAPSEQAKVHWMNQLKDAQDAYKLALKRSRDSGNDNQSILDEVVPSTPACLLPMTPRPGLRSLPDSPLPRPRGAPLPRPPEPLTTTSLVEVHRDQDSTESKDSSETTESGKSQDSGKSVESGRSQESHDSTSTRDSSSLASAPVPLLSPPPPRPRPLSQLMHHDSILSSSESVRSLGNPTISSDMDSPSPLPYIRRRALPLTPSTRRSRPGLGPKTSISPPASPARDRRLNTLKALHEKAKSMDIIFI